MASNDMELTRTSRPLSPSPSVSPTPAIGACPELSRCVSTASTTSTISAGSASKEAVGETEKASSRQSLANYGSRQSSGSYERQNRRGFVRPQGTNFAASAQSRDSVLSLGSITHIQWYFSRTGLLDGKGGQLARKKHARETLDLGALNTSFLPSGDAPERYSTFGSPELMPQGSSTPEDSQGEYYDSDDEYDHPDMLPPTVSTYNPREKPLPHPPSLAELKDDLLNSIYGAQKAVQEVHDGHHSPNNPTPPTSPDRATAESTTSLHSKEKGEGWHQIQGMHIIDVMTLAIRAAKMYYTAHDKPARLALIKSEREIRAELLSVMEVLRKMAARGFDGGMRGDEITVLQQWMQSVLELLEQEGVHEEAERKKRASWSWLDDSVTPDQENAREDQFLRTMDPDSASLPQWTPAGEAAELPTPFLKSFHDGQRLIHIHNAAVKESRKRYGAITTLHQDTLKPYRRADNLRYWIKAAELRWEIQLQVDVMSLVTEGTTRQVWLDFEAAIWRWAKGVRGEVAADFRNEVTRS